MSSNLTNAEFYQLHGTLTRARVEELLELEGGFPSVSTAIIKIKEARACLLGEDWLEPLMTQLRELDGHLKGANKERMKKVLAAAEDFAMLQFNNADYARSELRDALSELGAI